MKILVLGANGQLGLCLKDQFRDTNIVVRYASRQEIDISNFFDTEKAILKIAPDIIINASGYTAVDQAEKESEYANLINHLAVSNLAKICLKMNLWLIHLSTDYVFDGKSTQPYQESSLPFPLSIYGQTKFMGETSIQSTACKYFIIRTAWVYSEYGKNFLKSILSFAKERNTINVVNDQIGCPTYAQDIARVIFFLVRKILNKDQLDSSLLHYSGDIACSWYDFAKLIIYEANDLGFNKSVEVIPISTASLSQAAHRPPYSVLDCSKITKDFGITSSDVLAGIRNALRALL